MTTVTFRRERVTNDPNDVSLDQCVYFLYAWGGTFNVDTRTVGYHHGNREPSSTMVCLPSARVCPGEWNVCFCADEGPVNVCFTQKLIVTVAQDTSWSNKSSVRFHYNQISFSDFHDRYIRTHAYMYHSMGQIYYSCTG